MLSESVGRVVESSYFPVKMGADGLVFLLFGTTYLGISGIIKICNIIEGKTHGIYPITNDSVGFYREIGQGLFVQGCKQTLPMVIIAISVYKIFKAVQN